MLPNEGPTGSRRSPERCRITINLNGHRVVGNRTAGTTGILSVGHKHIAITNGIVDGFEIGAQAPGSEGLKITNVESRNNSLAGAVVDGSGIAVSKSVFRANGGPGLIVNDGTTTAKVTASFFVGNANSGLVSRATGTAITSIVTAANQGNRVLLNGAGNGSVQRSTLGNNGTNGIRVDQTFAPVALKKNVVAGNLPEGILLTTTGTGTTVDANVVGGTGGTGIAIMSNPLQNAASPRRSAPFDGGGNVAHDNIGPQQCTAPIVCQ